jgi:hypothetical protein
MSLIAKKKKGFTIPAGVYHGILVGIYDLGTQYSEKYHKDDLKVAFVFELPDAETSMDTPVTLCKIYTNSLHEKATLRKHIEALVGPGLSETQIEEGVDLSKLLGANVQLQVVQTESNGRTRMNIQNIMALAPKTKRLKSYSEHTFYNLNPSQDIPESTPEWIASLIKKSKEWEKGLFDEVAPDNFSIGDEEEPEEKTVVEAF